MEVINIKENPPIPDKMTSDGFVYYSKPPEQYSRYVYQDDYSIVIDCESVAFAAAKDGTLLICLKNSTPYSITFTNNPENAKKIVQCIIQYWKQQEAGCLF